MSSCGAIRPESCESHVVCVFGIMASGGGDFSGRKQPRKRYFPEDYDYTRILQYFSDDESDVEIPAEVADSEGEAISDVGGDASTVPSGDDDSGSEYRFSDDATASDDDGDGGDTTSGSSDDDFDVAAEQQQRRRARLSTSGRRIFQGRVSALRLLCVLF